MSSCIKSHLQSTNVNHDNQNEIAVLATCVMVPKGANAGRTKSWKNPQSTMISKFSQIDIAACVVVPNGPHTEKNSSTGDLGYTCVNCKNTYVTACLP